MTQFEDDVGNQRTEAVPGAAMPSFGLSAKLLLLTIAFVMIAEVLIYVPSIANFRLSWLQDHLHSAQIAALALDAAPDELLPPELQKTLLETAGVKGIAIKQGDSRRLLINSDMPPEVAAHFDIRDISAIDAITDAFTTIVSNEPRTIRVIGAADMASKVETDADFVEIVISEGPLRGAMLTYSWNILSLSIVISIITAALVYISLNHLLVRPMRKLTGNMMRFRENPEDHSRIIEPTPRGDEIGLAERELAEMQTTLSDTISQKAHLAALGLAVSKISHDLRNILATAQLVSDRLSDVPDPTVQRFAPKLIGALDRAIGLCTSTIRYGKVREAPADRRRFILAPLVDEVAEAVGLTGHDSIFWNAEIEPGLEVDADPDQLFRVLMNLTRNAVQALEADTTGQARAVALSARREGAVVTIEVADTGPGLPARAREHLFEAFQSVARPGGTGLGLAIAAELVRAHGGTIELVEGAGGARFRIVLPDRVVSLASRGAWTKPAEQRDAAPGG